MAPIVHVMSKNGMFLFRFNNGEFGSKWCGIWKGSQKYFDYFAFKLGDEFLSEANFKKFSFYNSQFSTLLFKTTKGKVIEEVKCYDDSVLVSITPDFDSASPPALKTAFSMPATWQLLPETYLHCLLRKRFPYFNV